MSGSRRRGVLVGSRVIALSDRDVPQILAGRTEFMLVATGPHREPLRRHHETGRRVELIVVLHLHRSIDMAEPVARAAIERPVHQHGLTHTRLDDCGGGGDLVGDEIAAAVHGVGPSQFVDTQRPPDEDRLLGVVGHESADAVDVGRREACVGDGIAASSHGHPAGRSAGVAGVLGTADPDDGTGHMMLRSTWVLDRAAGPKCARRSGF